MGVEDRGSFEVKDPGAPARLGGDEFAVGSRSCTATELLSRADEAMYEVKRASRAAALR